MVRCLDCYHMHQQDRTKDLYFCLKTREYLDHKIDQEINCDKYEAKTVNKYRY